MRRPAEDDKRLLAVWAAEGEADIRTVVDTERIAGASPFATILKTVSV